MSRMGIVLSLVAFLAACQTVPYQGQARDVKKKPREGGLIALPIEYRNEDRAKADEKMKANCGNLPVKIVSEEEAVVGQKTETDTRDSVRDRNQSQVGNLFGMPVLAGDSGGKDSRASATTTALKEWQISYQCDTVKTTKR